MASSINEAGAHRDRKTANTPSSDASTDCDLVDHGPDIVEIAAHGDIVLHVRHETKAFNALHAFRVSSPILKSNSKYFERLLQPGRFGEATSVEEKHKAVRERYGSVAEAPSAELPILDIQDVGRISNTVKSIDALLKDFLYILHGKDTQTFPPVANLANLAIVADRFDALNIVKSYVRRKKMLRAIDGKTTQKADGALSEEKVRQRLLVAILLDYPLWLEKYSARLITKGWVGREADLSSALWWDLPSRVEDELELRRACVLETIQSLQLHFLALYSSRERQCKLGYDSSAQCDSFQLGEMMRFFTRIGTLRFRGTILDTEEPPAPYDGDIYALLESLRQVPEYQIDKFHSHCGIRTKIVPLLNVLEECLQCVGICSDCWQEHRPQYAWIEMNRPLLWKRQAFLRPQAHGNGHAEVRAMFTATERDWS